MGLKTKVIILAHDFPPFQSIGAKRPASWFNHFHKMGIHPVVVTRHWKDKINDYSDAIQVSKDAKIAIEEHQEGTIIRVPYRPDYKDQMILKYGTDQFSIGRKLLSYLSLYFRFLFKNFDPTREIHSAAAAYLENNDCDYILATGEPFILFKYAATLSRQFQIPWIADYRDGWTSNQSNTKRGLLETLLAKYYRVFEKKYLQSVSLITTAAPGYAEDLKKIHTTKKIEVIYNGFEEEVLHDIDGIEQTDACFQIAYAGTLYPYQQLEVFLAGYQQFVQQNQPNTKLIFYGLSFYPDMVNRVRQFSPELVPYLSFTERMPYAKLMKTLRESHLMLLLSNENVNWLSAKVFDYLAVNRKIILVKNDFAILEKILKETQGGVAFSNSDEVAQFLQNQYAQFLETGKIKHQTKVDLFYTRSHQAKRMADLIFALTDKKASEKQITQYKA